MFDGEEIPSNGSKIEVENSEDQVEDVDENVHNFPETSQDESHREVIELQDVQISSRPSEPTVSDTNIDEENMIPEIAVPIPVEVGTVPCW